MDLIKKTLKKVLFEGAVFPASHVMMFHHIDDGSIIPKSGCVLEYDSFLSFIDSGLDFIAVDQYLKFSLKNRDKCVITFDDGLQDVYRVAYPELKKRNIPFTIFIATGLLDNEGYITTEELIALSKDPLVTVGSHGVSHELLMGMNEQQQIIELGESKKVIEALIHKPVKIFAYSHGKYDDTTLSLLMKNGWYQFAFGVQPMPTNVITRFWKWHLPRINYDNSGMRYTIVDTKEKKRLSYQ